jgi:hypothetical protein
MMHEVLRTFSLLQSARCNASVARVFAGHDPLVHDFMSTILRAVPCCVTAMHPPPPSFSQIFAPAVAVCGSVVMLSPSLTRAQVHMHRDPLNLSMHEFYAAGDGVHMYLLHVPPELLDLLLPLCMSHVRHLVLAAVPLSYIESRQPHRCAWFHDHVWSRRHGLFLRVV